CARGPYDYYAMDYW
nr:immunoglobulin heavy chain junction region [Mus musculus]